MTKVFLLSRDEFSDAEDRRMALARTRSEQYASLKDVLAPGAMWEVPWYFDPENVSDMALRREKALARIATPDGRNDYLSRYYWQTWSAIRPPLCVLCPNGVEWCIDSRSSNGEGWTITGTAPLITAAPSIAVPGYHGFLQNGVFTPDLDAATRTPEGK